MNLNISGILYITKWFHFSSDVQILKRKKSNKFLFVLFYINATLGEAICIDFYRKQTAVSCSKWI